MSEHINIIIHNLFYKFEIADIRTMIKLIPYPKDKKFTYITTNQNNYECNNISKSHLLSSSLKSAVYLNSTTCPCDRRHPRLSHPNSPSPPNTPSSHTHTPHLYSLTAYHNYILKISHHPAQSHIPTHPRRCPGILL